LEETEKMKQWIKNRAELETSNARKLVLDIIEAGFTAIDTESVIQSSVVLTGTELRIKNSIFNLNDVNHIYVVGFGKASCLAASALEKVLGSAITQGVAIGLKPVSCERIQTYGASHPMPTVQNVEISEKILELSKTLTEKDLVITVVSGGGSALLCWPMAECEQANRLYTEFLKTGGNIKELNTVRKHISLLKGGGLAKHLYPATVVGLIFSDVPGNSFEHVASGPTYKDETTITDAQKILDKYHLTGYTLNETPKEDKYFQKVVNIPLVSNEQALLAMEQKSRELGVEPIIISSELYDDAAVVARRFLDAARPGSIVLGAGEPRVVVTKDGGTGGRCAYLAMEILPQLSQGDVFASVASDGLDNSDVAGVIEDMVTHDRAEQQKLDVADYKERFDGYGFFHTLGNQLITGPTEANVSDFMVLYRE
jgi:glycerate 2-kinase